MAEIGSVTAIACLRRRWWICSWPGIWLSGAAIAAFAMIAFAALFPKQVHTEGAKHTDTI
jgi:hypothetical protein